MTPLPKDISALLTALAAPPRLIAHLMLVHDVAWHMTHMLTHAFPHLSIDREAVLYGAAVHDIGKTAVPSELSAPGTRHEQAGYQLLCENGKPHLAHFARDHANWIIHDQLELLLVSLADKIWKGKRIPELEAKALEKILENGESERWASFLALDEILEQLAATADERLTYQSSYPL